MFEEDDIVEFVDEKIRRNLMVGFTDRLFRIYFATTYDPGFVEIETFDGRHIRAVKGKYLKLADPRNIVRSRHDEGLQNQG